MYEIVPFYLKIYYIIKNAWNMNVSISHSLEIKDFLSLFYLGWIYSTICCCGIIYSDFFLFRLNLLEIYFKSYISSWMMFPRSFIISIDDFLFSSSYWLLWNEFSDIILNNTLIFLSTDLLEFFASNMSSSSLIYILI